MPGYYDTPFLLRVLLLALLLATVALADLLRHGRAATKWREYAFLFAAASAAAVLGALNDVITSRLSPEYFVAGKGLAPGDGLPLRAAGLGAHAGFVAGALAACCILWANSPRPGRTALSYRELARRSAAVPMATVGGGLIGATAGSWSDVGSAFAAVRAIHQGLYLGLAVGVGWLVASLTIPTAAGSGSARWKA